MKTTTLTLSLLMISSQLFALEFNSSVNIIGKPITTSMKDQVCHILTDRKETTCSSVRIANDYVLTAQHCVRDNTGKAKNNLELWCGDTQMEVAQIYESKEYAEYYASKEFEKHYDRKSHLDFAVLRLKNAKPAHIKVKLLKNLAEYKSMFLESGDSSQLKFSENTYCEMHGFGYDERKVINKYNSAALQTTTTYRKKEYFVEVGQKSENVANISSPLLPENDKREDWKYSTVRPGDSGGPLICKSKSGEWIVSGIASLLRSGVCSDSMQYPKRKFFEGKLQCAFNEWGLPTQEGLEKIVGVKL